MLQLWKVLDISLKIEWYTSQKQYCSICRYVLCHNSKNWTCKSKLLISHYPRLSRTPDNNIKASIHERILLHWLFNCHFMAYKLFCYWFCILNNFGSHFPVRFWSFNTKLDKSKGEKNEWTLSYLFNIFWMS